MNFESEIIKIIHNEMPKTPNQLNGLFESDAEVIRLPEGFSNLLYNIDEFSEEDFFRETDPYSLGWNMAVGTISDILATGGIPKYYAHNLVIKSTWEKEYIQKLSNGIADVLRQTGTSFIGGDFGTSSVWRYTGSVIGMLGGNPMLRSGAKKGDIIFMSGKIGLGNIEAALKIYSGRTVLKNVVNRMKIRFNIRDKEASLIRQFSSCCIDTSDGVFNAINTIANMSNVGFELHDLEYEKNGLWMSKILNLPVEMLLLGECGEFELLFTVPKDACDEFLEKARIRSLKFYRIGEIKEAGIKLLSSAVRNIDFMNYDIRARDYADTKEYLGEIIKFLNREV